jgi:hypothetical protein
VWGDPEDVDAAGGVLDDEERVQPVQCDGVDMEQVAGNAGSNTAADHISVLDAAIAQLPDQHRHAPRSWSGPTPRAAPVSSSLTSASRRDHAMSCEFSVGWAITTKERAAITAIWVWADAVDADGGHRDPSARSVCTRLKRGSTR